jgi:Ca-activated chloride channel family protein
MAASVLVSAQQRRDEAQLNVAVDVNLVVFNVAVTDGKGRPVSGLRATDFHIDEEGRGQDVALFDASDVPASVGLIVDNSGSMIDKRAEVIDAALTFVAASNVRDEMFVVNFNEHAYMGLPPTVPFTGDAQQIHTALLQRPPTGLTALYDALALGIEHLKAGTRDRKALVVLSDGGDNASRTSLDDVLLNARRSNATIYTIGIYDETNKDKDPKALRKIADLSGGRAYFPRELDDLDQVWREIAGGIRSQYTVAYHSSNPTRDGAFRKVRITAGRTGKRDLRVAARDGYFAPVGGPR